MSDVMLLGVLRMPMTDDPDPVMMRQFVERARQAACRIEADADEIAELRGVVERLTAEIASLVARLDELQTNERRLIAEISDLHTVMIAAAEEIQEHWEAHCDEEGYGPAKLMRRLEHGIPSQYGYTAGAFAALTAERDALRKEVHNFGGNRT